MSTWFLLVQEQTKRAWLTWTRTSELPMTPASAIRYPRISWMLLTQRPQRLPQASSISLENCTSYWKDNVRWSKKTRPNTLKLLKHSYKTLHTSLETVLLIIPLGGLMQRVTRSLHTVPIGSTTCKIIGYRALDLRTRTRFSQYWVVRALEPASFWPEIVIAVVILQRD